MILHVYIPLVETHIVKGSAIVGWPMEGGVLLYYEGGIYDQFTSYNEMLLEAARRCEQRYPTVAKRYLQLEQLDWIGTYDTKTRELKLHDGEAYKRLLAWVADTNMEHTIDLRDTLRTGKPFTGESK